MSEKKCKYLNTTYGIGRYICLWELKTIRDTKPCDTCKHNTEKEVENE